MLSFTTDQLVEPNLQESPDSFPTCSRIWQDSRVPHVETANAGVDLDHSSANEFRARGAISIWKVIYIAKGKSTAEMIRDALMAEGILANLRPVGRGAGDESTQQYEIMTPHAEAVEAYQLLTQVLRRGL